jgi:hypothetical protein
MPQHSAPRRPVQQRQQQEETQIDEGSLERRGGSGGIHGRDDDPVSDE